MAPASPSRRTFLGARAETACPDRTAQWAARFEAAPARHRHGGGRWTRRWRRARDADPCGYGWLTGSTSGDSVPAAATALVIRRR